MSMSTAMTDDGFRLRAMRAEEIAFALDRAAAEGWNPGFADALCFASVDPAGFLVGEHAGAPASTISVVNYDDRFAFLGFYIVRHDLRGRGFGLRTWQAAIAHAGARTIGLDGVARLLVEPDAEHADHGLERERGIIGEGLPHERAFPLFRRGFASAGAHVGLRCAALNRPTSWSGCDSALHGV
jgi:Acetyltransferase (GNAT) family